MVLSTPVFFVISFTISALVIAFYCIMLVQLFSNILECKNIAFFFKKNLFGTFFKIGSNVSAYNIEIIPFLDDTRDHALCSRHYLNFYEQIYE
ncbi:hypothetical protein EZS27_025259 [termite gut metagenome]|uniref:Uncharacterized protein n=1 Tax=termite gut metagenome TaxID=433724 RepID=A0A5J4QW30_9ZZZZ